MRNNLNTKKSIISKMDQLLLFFQIYFETLSSRLSYWVPSAEASLKITRCNWRRSVFSIRSVLTLITALNGFGKHYPSWHALYSNTGLVYASITWNYSRAQECRYALRFPHTCECIQIPSFWNPLRGLQQFI